MALHYVFRGAAEIVHQARPPQLDATGRIETPLSPRLLREGCDVARVAADPRRLEVGEVGERREDGVEPVRRDGRHRHRLRLERGLPLVGAPEPGLGRRDHA